MAKKILNRKELRAQAEEAEAAGGEEGKKAKKAPAKRKADRKPPKKFG